MPIRVELPDGNIAEFPDGMTNEDIERVLAQQFGGQQAEQPDFSILGHARRAISGERLTPEQLNQPLSLQPRPVSDALANIGFEVMAGVNRGAAGLGDFAASLPNALLQLAGREEQIPSLVQALAPATGGGFLEEGIGRDVAGAAGEVIPGALAGGGLLRSAAQQLPKFGAAAEGIGAGVLRELGRATPGQDIGYGALSGIGGEVGGDQFGASGQAVGALLAPLSVAGARNAYQSVREMVGARIGSGAPREKIESGANALIAEMATREGITPDQAAERLASLGPDAIPADIGESFSSLLRGASNVSPVVQGEARTVLGARQAGQPERITAALEEGTGTVGLDVDQEITKLNTELGPEISKLYGAARNKADQVLGGPKVSEGYSFAYPGKGQSKLDRLLSGENVGGEASKQAKKEITAKNLSGEPVSKLDLIDATKRALDDQISAAFREGKNNKARLILKNKNSIVSEADELIPEYAEARSLFAGKAELENAAELGQQFLKMKPRDVDQAITSYGDSERGMFLLGSKRAILDKMDSIQTNRDAVRALFGRNGDIQKMKSFFGDNAAYNKFAQEMEREATYILTKRAAQANSTTTKQLSDDKSFTDILDVAGVATGNPLASAGILARIADKGTARAAEEQRQAIFQRVGDILLTKGMKPDEIADLIRSGSADDIKKALTDVARTSPARAPTAIRVGALGAATEEEPQLRGALSNQ
jgi:hypothetical protein